MAEVGRHYPYREGEGFPEDIEDWESGDYESLWGGPEDKDLEPYTYPMDDLEEELEYKQAGPEGYRVAELTSRTAYRWHYDNTGYYAYVLFDGDAALRDDVVGRLEIKGVFSLAHGRSHKPADNGIQYDWYLRVAEASREKRRHPKRHLVASVFRQLPLYEPDESEETLELLGRIQQLEDNLERERALSDGFYDQLVESQERMAILFERGEALNSEIRGLREEQRTLTSRLAQQDQETGEAQEKVEELTASLSEKEKELTKTETELEDLFAEAGEVEKRANQLRAELRESEEKRASVERETDELRRRTESMQKPSVSSSKPARRVEDVLDKALDHLFPTLRLLNKRSVSTLVKEVNSPAGALKLLQQLGSDPGSFRSRPFRNAPAWKEEHYHTGVDDLGRLYYRKAGESDPHKHVVHVSHKIRKETTRSC